MTPRFSVAVVHQKLIKAEIAALCYNYDVLSPALRKHAAPELIAMHVLLVLFIAFMANGTVYVIAGTFWAFYWTAYDSPVVFVHSFLSLT